MESLKVNFCYAFSFSWKEGLILLQAYTFCLSKILSILNCLSYCGPRKPNVYIIITALLLSLSLSFSLSGHVTLKSLIKTLLKEIKRYYQIDLSYIVTWNIIKIVKFYFSFILILLLRNMLSQFLNTLACLFTNQRVVTMWSTFGHWLRSN